MDSEEIFKRLVGNGIDFLNKAISEHEQQPKYSVIHFHAAVEVFLKARLMKEHWTLVIAKRQEPDWNKFISGDFQSVTLRDAAARLDCVVRSGLSKLEIEIFEEITKHRNKMVHFFHEAHLGKNNKLQINIARQQLKAWYFLHKLLCNKWKNVFSPWKREIDEIDSSLRNLHDYLNVVFEDLKPEIQRRKGQGEIFETCPSCGFASKEATTELKEVFISKCLVCGLSENVLKIECTECDEIVTCVNEGFAVCGNCRHHIEPDELAGILLDDGAAHIAAMEGDYSWGVGNCSRCDGYQSVVRSEEEQWVCASCLEVFDEISCCGWCNEYNTGDMEHSYVTGCNHCDGATGWHKDD